MPQSNAPGASQTRLLFLVSVLGLFLELVLIRWIGTEIRIFAYLQNTVLVVCFLGLGLGCLSCRRPLALRLTVGMLFLLVLLLAVPFMRHGLGMISDLLGVFSDMVIWFQVTGTRPLQTLTLASIGLTLTFFLTVVIAAMFVPIGRLLGRLMDDHPRPIMAYSVNVAGSLLGIWLFVGLCALSQPPLVWLAVTVGLLLAVMFHLERPRAIDFGLLAGIVALGSLAGRDPGTLEVVWSPYQKLALAPAKPADADGMFLTPAQLGVYGISVNNVGYQSIVDLSEEHVAAHPDKFDPKLRGLSHYDLPALLHPRPSKVLLVGAGSGNDAAGVLRHPVDEVVAVEIDPAIIDFGRRHHPEKPYRDGGRVRVVNDDARSFFATSPKNTFDVIVFGLLDSHTTTAMTNTRLDHYVYTRESLHHARSLLREGGILVLNFEAQRDYIAERFDRTLTEVCGEPPLVFRVPFTHYGCGGLVFVAGDLARVREQIDAQPQLKAAMAEWTKFAPPKLAGSVPLATDDWPYLYLDNPRIPVLYFFLAGMLLLLFFAGLWQMKMGQLLRDWRRPHWHFFFMGAAFLLLEVQNISKAAVVLGNTWQVNAVIISGILVLILLANLIVSAFPRLPLAPVYALLCGSCVLLYFLDMSRFGFLPYPVKALAVGGLTSLPMLFSGIVFIRSFAAVKGKDAALGANLLGALIGGLLQSVTFLTGIKALLLIVTGLYVAALLTRPKSAEEQANKEPALEAA